MAPEFIALFACAAAVTVGLVIKNTFIRFVMAVIAVAVLLTVSTVALAAAYVVPWPTFFFEILGYATMSTLLVFSLLYRIQQPSTFVQFYLVSMTIKLVGGAAFVFAVIIKDKQHVKVNAAFFLLAYMLFTAIEVVFLYQRNARNRDHF